MVQRMETVHQVCMQATVHPVKIKTLPDGYEEKYCTEPNGVGFERDHVGIAVSHGPPEQDFESGPDGNSTADRPDDVIFHLA